MLVNNAGIAGPTGKVEESGPRTGKLHRRRPQRHVLLHPARDAADQAGGRRSIVNLSSVAGRLGFPMRTPYAAAKWAVVGFTKSLAMEAGPEKMRVNAIQPGNVEGERIDRVMTPRRGEPDSASSSSLSRLSNGQPADLRDRQDIANMALFLASPAGAASPARRSGSAATSRTG